MATKDMIHYEDWEKIDLKVGLIKSVKDHPNAEKLYVLKVDFGPEIKERTIVAGLRKYCTKEHLEGKRAIFLVNLEPKELRGVKSEGMILAASSPDKSHVCILNPDLVDMEPGSEIN